MDSMKEYLEELDSIVNKLPIKDLHGVVDNYFKSDLFDDSIDKVVFNINNEIRNLNMESSGLHEKLSKSIDENGKPCDDDFLIYEKICSIYNDLNVRNERLIVLQEMRIIYLFKNIEIIIKTMILEAFPELKVPDLHKWDLLKSYLSGISIKLGELRQYQFINQIRIVNNNLKHSSNINEETKKQNIPEFTNEDYFNADILENFYLRVRNFPLEFLKDLACMIEAYLYEFDDIRIKATAREYKARMNDEALLKFISALNGKV